MGRYKYLVCVDGTDNHNKYYEARENDDGSIDVRYGRVGKSEQKHHYTRYEKDFDDLIWSKEKKGYEDITDKMATKSVTEFKEMDDKEADAFLMHFYQTCRQIASQNYLNADSVSPEQVDTAKKYLASIEETRDSIIKDYIENNKSSGFDPFRTARWVNDDLQKLYAYIPRVMDKVQNYLVSASRNTTPQDLVDSINGVLTREKDLLDALKVSTTITRNQNGQTLAEACGVNIRLADYADEDKVKELMCRSHDMSETLFKIFAVENPTTHEAYDKCKKDLNISNEGLFFHGSGEGNWFSIMKNGMSLRPNAVITGKGLGNGLYFADDVCKAVNYANNYGNSSRYIGVYAVAIGKQQRETRYSQYSLSYLQNHGKDSIFLDASGGRTNGSGLNEICVYREEQADLRFIIETRNDPKDVRFSMKLTVPFTDLTEHKNYISGTAELSEKAQTELAKIGITTTDVEGVIDVRDGSFSLKADGETVKLTDDENKRLARDFKKSFFKNEYEFRDHIALSYDERSKKEPMKSFGKSDVKVDKKKTTTKQKGDE